MNLSSPSQPVSRTASVGLLVAAAAAFALLGGGHAKVYAAGALFTHGALQLRRGPSTDFAEVATLAAGKQISVLWCNDNDWCRIQTSDADGWAPMADITARDAAPGGAPGAAQSGTTTATATAASPNSATSAGTGSTGTGISVSIGGGAVAASVKLN